MRAFFVGHLPHQRRALQHAHRHHRRHLREGAREEAGRRCRWWPSCSSTSSRPRRRATHDDALFPDWLHLALRKEVADGPGDDGDVWHGRIEALSRTVEAGTDKTCDKITEGDEDHGGMTKITEGNQKLKEELRAEMEVSNKKVEAQMKHEMKALETQLLAVVVHFGPSAGSPASSPTSTPSTFTMTFPLNRHPTVAQGTQGPGRPATPSLSKEARRKKRGAL